MGKYFDELKISMEWLAKKEDTIFLGQAVAVEGTAMRNTLKDINPEKLLEMPVTEEMQAGIANGLSLRYRIPVSIYPRWNFLLLACNQIVNHLDKIPEISGYKNKVIIRVGVGSEHPLHPQAQHVGDFTKAFKLLCKNIEIIKLEDPEQIFDSYKHAYEREDGKSTILVEVSDYYNIK